MTIDIDPHIAAGLLVLIGICWIATLIYKGNKE